GQGGRVHAVVLTGVCQLLYLRSPSGFAWVGQSSAGWHAFAAPPAPEGAASHPRAAKAWHTARHGTPPRRPIHKASRSGKSTVQRCRFHARASGANKVRPNGIWDTNPRISNGCETRSAGTSHSISTVKSIRATHQMAATSTRK